MAAHLLTRSRPAVCERLCVKDVARIVFLALALLASNTRAQEAVSSGLKTPQISGYAEVSVANKYMYNGYLLESRGPVVQPYVELLGEFYTGKNFLTSVSAKVSVFSSFQFHNSGKSNMEKPIRTWYEAEFKPGLQFVFAERLTLTACYRRYESPNRAYSPENGFELIIEYDDSALLGQFALHPSLTWLKPFDLGADEAEEGNYVEFGLAPSAELAKNSRYPITMTLPIAVGLGDNRYYEGKHFGFASAGITAAIPLAFVPPAFGKWNFSVNVAYYRLGQMTAEASNDSNRGVTLFGGVLSTEF